MSGDNQRSGSDELTEEEFKTYQTMDDNIQDHLRKIVSTSEAAKTFLQTPLGISIRKVLLSEKMTAMKMCATHVHSAPDVINAHKRRYDVVCEVERVFSLIISDGDEAIRQLTLTVGDNDD